MIQLPIVAKVVPTPMTVIHALSNALELLDSLGYKEGGIHDNLLRAMNRIRYKYPKVAKEEL
jgi:hypothetical protein